MRIILLTALTMSFILSACTAAATPVTWPAETVPVTTTTQPFATKTPCTDRFVRHPLAHTVMLPPPVTLFASNGSGVATGDVNNDGNIDIVLANVAGDTTLALNNGDMTFREYPLGLPYTRAVQIIDIDGDGLRDISVTHRGAGISMLKNTGGAIPSFVRIPHGIHDILAYSMLWHDFDGDGRLDVATGSYDAEVARGGQQSLFDNHSRGVFVHTQQADGTFHSERLANEANALAMTSLDIDGNGFDDLVVGNDFDLRDHVWLRHADTWTTREPFTSTPHSTMSYDVGDIDRDGQGELFAADMNPYRTDVVTLATWLPVTSNMNQFHPADDPQLMENALLKRQHNSTWATVGRQMAVTATGWSWSSRFADFDNDGWRDLYVVNGMIAQELFPYLPDATLVEQNQALRFDGSRFVPMPQWHLDDSASGRGMAVADFDNDGDLDVVVNNLQSASVVFENQLCTSDALTLSLHQPGHNSAAIGAQVRLVLADAQIWEAVVSGRGYLSGDSLQLHFGVGNSIPEALVIRWPDGQVSRIEHPVVNHHLSVTRSTP